MSVQGDQQVIAPAEGRPERDPAAGHGDVPAKADPPAGGQVPVAGRERLVDRVDHLGLEPAWPSRWVSNPLPPPTSATVQGGKRPAIQSASSWNRNFFILGRSSPDRRPPAAAPGGTSPSSSSDGGG